MSEKEIEDLKLMYPKGTRIVLEHMDDIQAPPKGTLGTVIGIDDIGTIKVRWDTGSSLKLIPAIDIFFIA